MRKEGINSSKVDWVTVGLFALLALAGWLNVYASVYDEEVYQSLFDFSTRAGKQLMWIGTSGILIILIMVMDFRFFDSFSYGIYGGVVLLLILVLIFGQEVAGTRAWFALGPVKLQPSEFGKFATSLAVAKFLSDPGVKLKDFRNQATVAFIIGLPALLVLLQGDAGSTTVYVAMILVLYREGLNPTIIIIGVIVLTFLILTLIFDQLHLTIGILGVAGLIIYRMRKSWKKIFVVITSAFLLIGEVYGIDFLMKDVFRPHQRNRIQLLVNPNVDPLGVGWNVTQSKIAIGSGGFFGKGFLNGTQTKFNFVPEQDTDFIFCTIGEEHGWIGSFFLVGLFMALFLRIIHLAERQKSRFGRVYGYCVACILFYHFLVNIGMTIGLIPVMGIPLPFFSYGGSSLWSFTIFLFILVKLDAHRMQVLERI
ncbi:rod shape-determining protein RodA [Xanthovirga aplysinae]|uniref:rod shape-determining protein RodA n=1 Tax=Xanthovirga aplysinae TaxID=2529853 RepID=UPI0016569EFE|nr:rod shape-determining protein RodA [Xanthovirga aplysinae]